MKTIRKTAPAAIAIIGLAGLLGACIHVDDDGYSDTEEVAVNTERALDVCGAGNVAEVTDEGFVCKD